MDLHHNAQGIAIGVANPRATDAQRAVACDRAMQAGQLMISAPAADAAYQ